MRRPNVWHEKFVMYLMKSHQPAAATTRCMTPAQSWAHALSYISAEDTESFCFTGAYGKVMNKSSGSLLYLGEGPVASKPLDKSNMLAFEGKVRFFSPREILNLLGFPAGFGFPASIR